MLSSLKLLVNSSRRLKLIFLACLVGIPTWYVAGILSYFAPEFAKSFEVSGEVTAGMTIMMGYLGAILGDIACGLLSQKLQSRKKAILIFSVLGAALALLHPFFSQGSSPAFFYWIRFAIGFGCGYTAVLVAWIAELFGTNLRATLTTTLTNLIRASIIPLTLSFKYLMPRFGIVVSSQMVGFFCFLFGILAIFGLPETFHRNLDYLEKSTCV